MAFCSGLDRIVQATGRFIGQRDLPGVHERAAGNGLVEVRSRLGHCFDTAPTSICRSLRGEAKALEKGFRPFRLGSGEPTCTVGP
jgi:hypothetical protein